MQWYIIFSLCLAILYFTLLLWYKKGWHQQKPAFYNPTVQNTLFYSIIIPARNEAANIGTLLQSIINNNFDNKRYEIIVIDDFSEDATSSIASHFFDQHPTIHGKVIALSQYISPTDRINAFKKKALEIAISVSKGDIIITTDADCKVKSTWIQSIAHCFDNVNTQFVAAPVLLTPNGDKATVLYYFQHLDFMTMQGITAAVNQLKAGNMCNGANLAFRKTAFYEVGGYYDINHLASGDDMMLMHKFEKKYPAGIYFLKSPAAIVTTPVQASIHDFLQQRIRWASKSGKYNDHKLNNALLLVYLFNFNFLVGIILACWQPSIWIMLGTLLVVKACIEFLFLIPVARFFEKSQSLSLFPILQPLHIAYIIMAGWLGYFGKYEWKGRAAR